MSEKQVILVDPMLATGSSICIALKVLLDLGVKEEKILFLVAVASPEGLRTLTEKFPRVS